MSNNPFILYGLNYIKVKIIFHFDTLKIIKYYLLKNII